MLERRKLPIVASGEVCRRKLVLTTDYNWQCDKMTG
ncbi:unnamed protein product [Ixodes persulcatus]